MMEKLRVGALISGGGSNLQAIIDACEAGEIDARVVFVGSDNPDAFGLKRAEKHKIPGFVVDYPAIIKPVKKDPEHAILPDDFDLEKALGLQKLMDPGADRRQTEIFLKSRAIAEAGLISAMAEYTFDLLVLAGFMRNLTPYFIDKINTNPEKPRIMNIHPAILPSFPGVDGYGDTFRYGCKAGGSTVHFIDYGEDSGPIIGQKTFDILPGYDLDTVKKKGLEQEWLLYPACIQLFAENRLKTVKKTFTLDSGKACTRTIVEILP